MTSKSADKNQRKYPRIPLSMEFKCGRFVNPVKFVSKNVSEGGVFVQSSKVYPLEAQIDLQFNLPYAFGELKLKGRVVRHSLDAQTGTIDGMAIEFLNLPEAEKKMISEYITNTQEAAGSGDRSEG